MNILPIKTCTFRENDFVIGYDDAISKRKREFIRYDCAYNNPYLRYYDIYEKEPRLEEYPLQRLISFFYQKPKKINGELITELPLSNVSNISSSSRYKPNIYRGSTLYDCPSWVLEKIKSAGIKTVIDLANFGDEYKKQIEEAGLKYVSFPLKSICSNHNLKCSKEELIEFIKTMQNEYVYLGCSSGTTATDVAIFLNTLFNPNVKGYCKINEPESITGMPEKAIRLYDSMTAEDKQAIGWTKEFEERFNSKIKRMLEPIKCRL